MVMSIWRCSLLDQYFELETGSRGAARSPPCAPETGGQPVTFHVTDCVSESEIGLPLWSFAGVKRPLDRKIRQVCSSTEPLPPEEVTAQLVTLPLVPPVSGQRGVPPTFSLLDLAE